MICRPSSQNGSWRAQQGFQPAPARRQALLNNISAQKLVNPSPSPTNLSHVRRECRKLLSLNRCKPWDNYVAQSDEAKKSNESRPFRPLQIGTAQVNEARSRLLRMDYVCCCCHKFLTELAVNKVLVNANSELVSMGPCNQYLRVMHYYKVKNTKHAKQSWQDKFIGQHVKDVRGIICIAALTARL